MPNDEELSLGCVDGAIRSQRNGATSCLQKQWHALRIACRLCTSLFGFSNITSSWSARGEICCFFLTLRIISLGTTPYTRSSFNRAMWIRSALCDRTQLASPFSPLARPEWTNCINCIFLCFRSFAPMGFRALPWNRSV